MALFPGYLNLDLRDTDQCLSVGCRALQEVLAEDEMMPLAPTCEVCFDRFFVDVGCLRIYVGEHGHRMLKDYCCDCPSVCDR